jgi:hypothetical protein
MKKVLSIIITLLFITNINILSQNRGGMFHIITVSPGATINPASGVARNFSSPVTYTVSSGYMSQTWIVTVTTASQPSSDVNVPVLYVTRPLQYDGKIVVIK